MLLHLSRYDELVKDYEVTYVAGGAAQNAARAAAVSLSAVLFDVCPYVCSSRSMFFLKNTLFMPVPLGMISLLIN